MKESEYFLSGLLTHFGHQKIYAFPELLDKEDGALVKLMKQGDIQAFLVLVRRNIEWVTDVMLACGKEEEAWNRIANTFLSLWRCKASIPAKYEHVSAKFRYYIFDFIMRNHAIYDIQFNSIDANFQ